MQGHAAYPGAYSYPFVQQHFVPSAAAVGAPPPPGWHSAPPPPPPGTHGGTAAEAEADAFLNNYYKSATATEAHGQANQPL
jgi:hypothetical protein